MDAQHIFDHMWERYNSTDVESNAWREGGRDWMEAMGGADGYLYQGLDAEAPSGAVPIDVSVLKTQGWVPCQDRWADFDLFNTTYVRPRPGAEDGDPLVRRACGPLQGAWCAREQGSRVIWTNKYSLCELHLTAEGYIFLSDWDRWRGDKPRAVRVEYGLAGCVDGVNALYKMSNAQARHLLGFSQPKPEAVADVLLQYDEGSAAHKLVKWCEHAGWHELQRRLLERGPVAEEVGSLLAGAVCARE